MSRAFVNKLYDADDATLNLDTMEKLMEKPGETYGSWYTRQSFRVEINFYEHVWYADLFIANDPIANYLDPDIFSLIRTILENHGK